MKYPCRYVLLPGNHFGQKLFVDKQKSFFRLLFSVYFSWRQEKYQKKAALQLGLRLPSRKRLFRRGQELARLRRAQTAYPLFPKKAFALGCAAMGGANH